MQRRRPRPSYFPWTLDGEIRDDLEARTAAAANRGIYERVRAAGGTLYPASAALPMSGDDWEQHFGPVFSGFRRAKRAFDPGHVLTPGYAVFGEERRRR